MRRRNTLLIVAGIVVVLLFVIAGARGRGGEIPVREVTVGYRTFTTKLPETGVVQRPEILTVPAGVGGNLGEVMVRAGDVVPAGALLATITNTQIVSNESSAEASAAAAAARAQTALENNAVLPAQNHSAVVQAQANVVTASAQLAQAKQDLVAGAQSGLGYGGSTASEQRLDARAAVEKADTDLREAKRIYDADVYLYDQRGVSHDQLLQAQAHYEEMKVTDDQAKSQRQILEGTLTRNEGVLENRVRAAEDALAQAHAALASAQTQAGQSHAGEVAAARADAGRAQTDLAYARQQVARLQVRAPVAGTVLSIASEPADPLRTLRSGDTIEPGTALFTLGKPGPFVVKTRVDEQDVSGVTLGQRAVVSGEDLGTKKLSGRVVAVSPIAQRSDDPSNTSRQVITTIALDSAPPFLRDGMTVDVDIITHDQPHVLVVPVDALHSDEHGNYVYVIDNGVAKRTTVKLGAQNDSGAVALSGLDAGVLVAADKNAAIVDGSHVTAAPSPTPNPSAAP